MRSDPIAAILAAQDPAGWWVKAGPGDAPKYTGTVWSVIFLDQLGADPCTPRWPLPRDVLSHAQASSGGFAASGEASEAAPPPSRVIHCLTGNLLAALIGWVGWMTPVLPGPSRGRRAPSQVSAGRGSRPSCPGRGSAAARMRAYRAPGSGQGRPWPLPASRHRTYPAVSAALDAGVAFLLSHDPAVADYPMGFGNTKPNGSWFRLGFPSGYVADVLQVLEALCAAGVAGDARLGNAVEWLGTAGRGWSLVQPLRLRRQAGS